MGYRIFEGVNFMLTKDLVAQYSYPWDKASKLGTHHQSSTLPPKIVFFFKNCNNAEEYNALYSIGDIYLQSVPRKGKH